MKDKKPLDWIPLYIDKHLFGSTRIELEPDERSVWMDMLALAGKDNGFIRANEAVPYLPTQLAGMLVITEELLDRTIQKCIEYKKIDKLPDGTMYLPSWPNYRLSPRHKRRFDQETDDENDAMSANPDTMSKKPATIEKEKNRESIEKEKLTIVPTPWTKEQEILVDYFISGLIANNPKSKAKSMTEVEKFKWYNEMRLLNEKDGWKMEDLKYIVQFVLEDEFEKCNVLSIPKLRKRIDNLAMKTKRALEYSKHLRVGSRS